MQNEVGKAAVNLPVLQQEQQPLQQVSPALAATVQAVIRPSTSGSSGGMMPAGTQQTYSTAQQQQPRPTRGLSSTQPVPSSPLQQQPLSQSRPQTATSSPQHNQAAVILQHLTRPNAQITSNTAILQTPIVAKTTTAAAATTPSGGALPALPPSPPLTRSATRSRSSVITATQNQQYVDYLLQHGGLQRPVSISFSPQRDPHHIDYIPGNTGDIPEVSYSPINVNSGCDDSAADRSSLTVFTPLHCSLDAYAQILASGGSIAVGTGYRSVARRLLERVEALFARDIGLPWGETLEWLRGKRRRERLPALPVLPVRSLLKKAASGVDEGEAPTILGNNQGEDSRHLLAPPPAVPLQQPPADGQGVHQMLAEGEKIRTKTKVEEWLDETETVISTTINNNTPNSGPMGLSNGRTNDVAGIFYVTVANQFHASHQNPQAHDTLQDVASTTSQEEEEEKLVSSIVMELLNESPLQKEHYAQYLNDNALLERTMLSLRRLYPSFHPQTITRCIAALYLLLHPDLHPVLEAISKITKGELDLLNSGRFDGFLDEKDVIPADEEKELEALETLDGNIFRTMEQLEDEIEALHVRAEELRRKLRVRKEAIARKMVLAGKEKESGGTTTSGAMEQFGGPLGRQNSITTTPLVKHVQLPPPPPKSDYFEGLDRESTLNPIMPDDSASNYGSRHRRRTSRKAASSALAGDEGNLARRNSAASGASGGIGSAAQHLMKKQLEREKDKRDKERSREKFEKERERREKEERRKAKFANAAAIGMHHRGISVGDAALTPYLTGEQGPEKEKALPGSPLALEIKKSASKEDQKDKERERDKEQKRDRHRSPERPTTSGKKGTGSQEFVLPPGTAGGVTVTTASPLVLLEDALVGGKERITKEIKKKEKNKEDKEKDKSRKEVDDEQPTINEEKKEVNEKRRFGLKLPKFLSLDHENEVPTPTEQARPGTSGSLRPNTAQSANTGITTATNTTSTELTSSGKHYKERRQHARHKVIPEVDGEDEDGDEKIIRHHHSTRRKSSRRTTRPSGTVNVTTTPNKISMEVLSEPEDIFGREEKPRYNLTGVFSEDEGGAGGKFGGMGTGQQLMRKGLRRSSESKKVARDGMAEEKSTEKDKGRKGKDRDREERRERKCTEESREKEKDRLRDSAGVPSSPQQQQRPSSSYTPNAQIIPLATVTNSQALAQPGGATSDDNLRPRTATSDINSKQRKAKDKKLEYQPSFSSSVGGGSGGGAGGGGVSLLDLQDAGGDVLLTSFSAGEGKEVSGFDDEAMTLAEGTTMVGEQADEGMGAGERRSRTPRATATDADRGWAFVDGVD